MSRDVASSISVNGMGFKRYFETFVPMFVHDPSLEVIRGLNNARVFRSHYDLSGLKKYPVILFNRSPVRRSSEFGQVGVHHNIIGNKNSNFDWQKFYGVWGTIQYNFLFVAQEQRQCEQFEVMFTSDRHIASMKKFTSVYHFEDHSNLDESGAPSILPIGPFEYELLWDDLGEYGYSDPEVSYITIGGSFKLNGEHIVFLDELAKGIKYVVLTGYAKSKIKSQRQELFKIELDLTKDVEVEKLKSNQRGVTPWKKFWTSNRRSGVHSR